MILSEKKITILIIVEFKKRVNQILTINYLGAEL